MWAGKLSSGMLEPCVVPFVTKTNQKTMHNIAFYDHSYVLSRLRSFTIPFRARRTHSSTTLAKRKCLGCAKLNFHMRKTHDFEQPVFRCVKRTLLNVLFSDASNARFRTACFQMRQTHASERPVFILVKRTLLKGLFSDASNALFLTACFQMRQTHASERPVFRCVKRTLSNGLFSDASNARF